MSAFDPEQLTGLAPIEARTRLTPTKVILYALGVGATELPYVYEENLLALPTMAVILGYPGFIWRDPAYKVDWRRILHAETGFTLHAPLPTEGELIGLTRFGPVLDKGPDKGAIVYQTRTVHTADGRLVATVRNANFLRGDGGRGGSGRGAPAPYALPPREPDLTHAIATAQNQALIYRLSGDLNPLHVDPIAARAAGFERPILHGLCTFGVAGRALVATVCDGDVGRVRSMDARFSSPAYPGDTLTTEIWREGAGHAGFRVKATERGVVVLNNGRLDYA